MVRLPRAYLPPPLRVPVRGGVQAVQEGPGQDRDPRASLRIVQDMLLRHGVIHPGPLCSIALAGREGRVCLPALPHNPGDADLVGLRALQEEAPHRGPSALHADRRRDIREHDRPGPILPHPEPRGANRRDRGPGGLRRSQPAGAHGGWALQPEHHQRAVLRRGVRYRVRHVRLRVRQDPLRDMDVLREPVFPRVHPSRIQVVRFVHNNRRYRWLGSGLQPGDRRGDQGAVRQAGCHPRGRPGRRTG